MYNWDGHIIRKEATLIEALRRLNDLSGKTMVLFAVDSDGKMTGTITDGDIRRAMEKWQAEFFDRTVADIMTQQPKTVSPKTRITEIQDIMNKYKIHTVLVVDETNHLLGVVDHYSCMV